MPYKYIGRTTDFRGKSLWEILGNLKNFGVGRILVRSRYERYPEPTFIKVLKVETLPQPENPSPDNSRKIRVLVENTFRGVPDPKPVLIERASYKCDYRLIPKDEEVNYTLKTATRQEKTTRILPRTMDFPPLLKELVARDCINSKGEVTEQDLQLPIVYNRQSKQLKYKIAAEGETPTEKITVGLGKPVCPSLYEGLNITA